MKNVIVTLVILICSQQLNAQIQFKFADCLNKWSPYVDAGNGVKVSAAYIKNDAGDQWWVRYMNTNNKFIAFSYTVYGVANSFTTNIRVEPNGVSPVTDANFNLGDLYGDDIFISCSNFAFTRLGRIGHNPVGR